MRGNRRWRIDSRIVSRSEGVAVAIVLSCSGRSRVARRRLRERRRAEGGGFRAVDFGSALDCARRSGTYGVVRALR